MDVRVFFLSPSYSSQTGIYFETEAQHTVVGLLCDWKSKLDFVLGVSIVEYLTFLRVTVLINSCGFMAMSKASSKSLRNKVGPTLSSTL